MEELNTSALRCPGTCSTYTRLEVRRRTDSVGVVPSKTRGARTRRVYSCTSKTRGPAFKVGDEVLCSSLYTIGRSRGVYSDRPLFSSLFIADHRFLLLSPANRSPAANESAQHVRAHAATCAMPADIPAYSRTGPPMRRS